MPSGITADHCTGARNTNASAATLFAMPRITFFAALARGSVVCMVRSSRASSSTPAAAPK